MARSIRFVGVAVVVGLLVMVAAQEVFPLDVQKVAIIQAHGYTGGVSDGYFFEVLVEGTGITNARVVDKTSNASLTHSGGNWWEYEDPVTYASYAALTTAHPASGWLTTFYFNEGQPDCDTDVLGYNVTAGPNGFATITNPTHNATGVDPNPNYQWSDVSGLSNAVGIHKFVDEAGGPVWYQEFFDNDLTQTSWQPGALSWMTDYHICVAVVNLQGGVGMPMQAMTNTRNDPYDYYGVFAQANENDFTTAPEPGTVALIGTAMLALVGLRWRRRMK